jgi:hypothetical protein
VVCCAGSGGVHPKSDATDGSGDQEQVERAEKGNKGEPSRGDTSRHDHKDLAPVSPVGEPATQLLSTEGVPGSAAALATAGRSTGGWGSCWRVNGSRASDTSRGFVPWVCWPARRLLPATPPGGTRLDKPLPRVAAGVCSLIRSHEAAMTRVGEPSEGRPRQRPPQPPTLGAKPAGPGSSPGFL